MSDYTQDLLDTYKPRAEILEAAARSARNFKGECGAGDSCYGKWITSNGFM